MIDIAMMDDDRRIMENRRRRQRKGQKARPEIDWGRVQNYSGYLKPHIDFITKHYSEGWSLQEIAHLLLLVGFVHDEGNEREYAIQRLATLMKTSLLQRPKKAVPSPLWMWECGPFNEGECHGIGAHM